MNTKSARPIDKIIGEKIKTMRLAKSWSQTRLAQTLNLTFQQIQKYEKGTNRITVGRLFDISCVLNVPIAYFLEGCENQEMQAHEDLNLPMINKEILDLVRNYSQIKNLKLRKQLRRFATAMAGINEGK